MRQRARTDLCGGRSVMVVPTATPQWPMGVREGARGYSWEELVVRMRHHRCSADPQVAGDF